jgi:PleD family two-component response regulator
MGFEAPTIGTTINITMSFGLAGIEKEQPNAQEIIHCADLAMYAAKDGGRNQIRIYSADLAGLTGRPRIDERMLNG